MPDTKPTTIAVVTVMGLILLGCFPSKEVTLVTEQQAYRTGADSTVHIETPTKAYLLDASVLLFPEGFSVANDTLQGWGERYGVEGTGGEIRHHSVLLDSVAAMAHYELKHSAGGNLGSALLLLAGSVLTPLSIRCITCPKCCFGSCPTLYTTHDDSLALEAELFSYSLSKYFQEDDLDRLSRPIPEDGHYRIRVSNEALETHYINTLSLVAVHHPDNTQVFPSNEGDFIATGDLHPPIEATNALGHDVLALVRLRDDRWYRSDTMMVRQLGPGRYKDWLDLKVEASPTTTTLTLVLHLRNTLLTTVLFYDVVLASQGVEALAWTQRLNTDSSYAALYHERYRAYDGIDIKVHRDGQWITQASLDDVGPLAWKDVAIKVPVSIDQEGQALVRLEFFPDNVMIDHIAFEVGTPTTEALVIEAIEPASVRDHTGRARHDVWPLIEADDDRFLVTNPSEAYHFTYTLPPTSAQNVTVFMRSKGYYTEWLRGDWVTTRTTGYQFDLYQIDQAIAQLKQSWLTHRPLLEKTFFETRIPIQEK